MLVRNDDVQRTLVMWKTSDIHSDVVTARLLRGISPTKTDAVCSVTISPHSALRVNRQSESTPPEHQCVSAERSLLQVYANGQQDVIFAVHTIRRMDQQE